MEFGKIKVLSLGNNQEHILEIKNECYANNLVFAKYMQDNIDFGEHRLVYEKT